MTKPCESVQAIGWIVGKSLPDSLCHVRVLRIPEPIQRTLRSLPNPMPKLPAIASLHDALGALSTAIIAFDPLVVDESNPSGRWMYFRGDSSIHLKPLQNVIRAWLIACYGDTLAHNTRSDWKELHWGWNDLDVQSMDFALRKLLLPGLMARWLLDQNLTFDLDSKSGCVPIGLHLAPLMTQRGVAELISNPIEERGRRFSIVLRLWLDRIPGSGEDVLYSRMSVRRWRSNPLITDKGWIDLAVGRNKSVYLRQSSGYLDERPRAEVFSRISMRLTQYGEGGLRWVGFQPLVYTHASVSGAPPDVVDLARQPNAYSDVALITMENRETARHKHVGTGYTTRDHQLAYQSLNAVMHTIVEALPVWKRVHFGGRYRISLTHSQKRGNDVADETRRQGLARLAPGTRIELYVQDTDAVKQTILRAVGMLDDYKDQIAQNPLIIYYRQRPALEIVNGTDDRLTALLAEGTTSRTSAQATEQRRQVIARQFERVAQPTGAFVALSDYRFTPFKSRDPKAAIRFGLLGSGRVSQFFVPKGQTRKREDETGYQRRLKSAVGDLLRVLGYRYNDFFMPQTELPLPPQVDLLAFWLFQLNARSKNEHKVFLPVVIDVPCGDSHLRVFVPRATGTAEECSSLYEGILTAAAYDADFSQLDAIVRFFRDALRRRDQSRPTLLLLHDQNLRRMFSELNDQTNPGRLNLYGLLESSNIRAARLRSSNDGEAPMCVPTRPMGKYSGLYGHPKHPNVFYSIHKLGERHAGAEWRKLDRVEQPAAVPSTLQIWMSNLQPGDEAAAWAMLVHRLRQESSHTDNETVLPQPLHDAQKIKEYLSRYANDAKEDDDVNAIEPAPTEGSQ